MNDQEPIARLGQALAQAMLGTMTGPDPLNWQDTVFAAGLAVNAVAKMALMTTKGAVSSDESRALVAAALAAAMAQHIEVVPMEAGWAGPGVLAAFHVAKKDDTRH